MSSTQGNQSNPVVSKCEVLLRGRLTEGNGTGEPDSGRVGRSDIE